MGIINWLLGTAWRGMNGEDAMTEDDWARRGHDQAISMLNGDDPFRSSPDEDGYPTGGNYNGDYPQSWHDECNRRLDQDEYYEAETGSSVEQLYQNWKDSQR